MTTLVASAMTSLTYSASYARSLGPAKLLLLAILAGLALVGPETREIMAAMLADAYLQVSVFVAATLGLIYFVESRQKTDFATFLDQHRRWQIPIAALLGALPGCGGAVVVVVQYVRGAISFGAVVAVLTATMGDAAFLLLAAEPTTAVAVYALGAGVGIVSGTIIDLIHGPNFMRQARLDVSPQIPQSDGARLNPLRPAWFAVVVPGFVLGVLLLLEVDTDALFGPLAAYEPTQAIGMVGALLALGMWTLDPEQRFDPGVCRSGGPMTRMMDTTNFVTVWVVVGFLVYELGVHFTGIDLGGIFHTWAYLVPLLAVVVGFLPGCGPQIVVTTLYIQEVVPLSAQLGNAISNDGDALFPAIAIAPKAAIVATLYSAVPAVMVAYGYFMLFE
ncbi:Putative, 10TM heavy-metal exporter [Limimonas halophila]|uniref:Putative, 10TM heavy-metal exporter n=1 Tax=Limimonas halophila TaxID=1082479 RepID=A0A1G7QTH6_9PROT|nr:putative manganese transporter [Limimonas halophila]SDG01764.1 Putative, 10TM heavy-metal exporter [Limimonas halophila]